MTEHRPYRRVRFLAQQVEQCGHGVRQRATVERNIHEPPIVNQVVAITGDVGRLERGCRYAWGEHLPIPCSVILVRDHAGILAAYNLLDAPLLRLECLPENPPRSPIARST